MNDYNLSETIHKSTIINIWLCYENIEPGLICEVHFCRQKDFHPPLEDIRLRLVGYFCQLFDWLVARAVQRHFSVSQILFLSGQGFY